MAVVWYTKHSVFHVLWHWQINILVSHYTCFDFGLLLSIVNENITDFGRKQKITENRINSHTQKPTPLLHTVFLTGTLAAVYSLRTFAWVLAAHSSNKLCNIVVRCLDEETNPVRGYLKCAHTCTRCIMCEINWYIYSGSIYEYYVMATN
jgi:hypothetical protein